MRQWDDLLPPDARLDTGETTFRCLAEPANLGLDGASSDREVIDTCIAEFESGATAALFVPTISRRSAGASFRESHSNAMRQPATRPTLHESFQVSVRGK